MEIAHVRHTPFYSDDLSIAVFSWKISKGGIQLSRLHLRGKGKGGRGPSKWELVRTRGGEGHVNVNVFKLLTIITKKRKQAT